MQEPLEAARARKSLTKGVPAHEVAKRLGISRAGLQRLNKELAPEDAEKKGEEAINAFADTVHRLAQIVSERTPKTRGRRYDSLLRRAEFWDRPPKEIHTEISRRGKADAVFRELPRAVMRVYRRTRRITALYIGSVPKVQRPFVRLLSDPFEWSRVSPSEREGLLDKAIADSVARSGPLALANKSAQRHLASLWETIHRGATIQERLEAKRRWKSLFVQAVPNFRGRTDPPNPMVLLNEYEQASARVREIQAQRLRSEEAYLRKLKEVFPEALQRHLAGLAEALAFGFGSQKRDNLLAIVASSHGVSGHTLREVLPEARRLGLEARIQAGYERYKAWLCQSSQKKTSK